MKRFALMAAVVGVGLWATVAFGDACESAEAWGWRSAYYNIQCVYDFLTGWVT